MHYVYEPFILRRLAEDRIFVCSPKIPFEYTICCFQAEKPFFMISQFEDGRVAITPNVMYLPQNFLQAGYGSWNILPSEYEYVTVKNATYPLIVTAHPVKEFNAWLRNFESLLATFAKRTLWEFIEGSLDFEPITPTRQHQVEREMVAH